jgi:putative endonuclease
MGNEQKKESKSISPDGFFAYLLECADGTLYAGWSVNVERRLIKHNLGLGARYTRTRLPVRLLKSWTFESKQEAMRYEFQLKQLTRSQKLALLAQL